MKILRYLGYSVGVLGVIVAVLIGISMLGPQTGSTSGLIQTITVDGKTVKLVRSGPGDINFSTKVENGRLIVNGVTFDLSGGTAFTVLLSADGKAVLRKD